MYLRTKVDVDYNAGITGTQTGIVLGQLGLALWENDFNKVGANYTYFTYQGVKIHNAAFFVEGDEIDAFYDAIKTEIPEGLGKRDTERYTFILAFMSRMADTFGITTADIEIVEGLIE
jgi:hypothetical protein